MCLLNKIGQSAVGEAPPDRRGLYSIDSASNIQCKRCLGIPIRSADIVVDERCRDLRRGSAVVHVVAADGYSVLLWAVVFVLVGGLAGA
jgi:hypothetical protein